MSCQEITCLCMLRIGDTAPGFSLPDQNGTAVSLDDLLRTGQVILYFYPADFTPVCTREACAFRDRFDDLREVSVPLVGISPQSVASHHRFAQLHDLPFPLLADTDRSLIRAFGVSGPFGFGVRRATFLVDQQRRIVNRAVSDLFLASHLSLVQKVLDVAEPER